MAKKQTVKKIKGGKVVGSGGLTSKTKFNWKLVLPVVILVSLVGGYLVYTTQAATNYAFVFKYQNLSGGVVRKIGSVGYRVIDSKGVVYRERTPYLATKNGGARPCAHFKLLSNKANVRLLVDGNTWSRSDYSGKNSTFNICASSRMFGSNTVSIQTNGQVGVDTIYAKR